MINLPVLNIIPKINYIRPLLINKFDDDTGYVYSAENPFGVKYLTKEYFQKYLQIVESKGNPPNLSLNDLIDEQFVKNGLATCNDNFVIDRKLKPKALTVWFHISNACNLSCQYCYIPKLVKAVDLKEMNNFFMSAETTRVSMNRLFEYCLEQGFTHLQIKFAGGEPTLNTKLIEETCKFSLNRSRETGVKVGFRILTNGVFINDDIYEIFTKYRFGVSISIDGDKERHNEIRFTISQSRIDGNLLKGNLSKEGSWDEISYNIDKLLYLGIKPYILCTVTKKNYKHLMELAKFCISKQIGFRLSPVRDKKSHLIPGFQDDFLKEMVKLYEWIGENLPVTMPLERFARFAEWNLQVKKQIVCGTCKSTMSIDQNGDVASCQMRMNKPFGNVELKSLKEITNLMINDESNNYIVYPENKTKDCVTCYWRFTCAGGCPEHTRNAIGTTNSPSPWCHLYMELLPVYIKAVATQIKRAIETRKIG